MRLRPAPLWFVLVLVVAEALLWRWLLEATGAGSTPSDPAPPVALAFWGFVSLVAGFIFKGAQVAAKIALAALQWSVKALWAFASSTYNAVVALGRQFIRGVREAWEFLRNTYDHVLKPAWSKFWGWIQQLQGWLERTFGPVFEWLERVRKWVLDFYNVYVRPILDAIGIARRVLNVLASLGIEWARALDRKLAELEEKIEAPFRLAIAKLNEVIGIVNRVVTLDGLFQRLALIRSIERDMRYVGRAFVNWRSRPITQNDFDELKARVGQDASPARMREDFTSRVTASGPRAGAVHEHAAIWKAILERPQGR